MSPPLMVFLGGSSLIILSLPGRPRRRKETRCVPPQFGLDDVGKGILAIALSAQSTGAPVQADGTFACSIWGDTETLNDLS